MTIVAFGVDVGVNVAKMRSSCIPSTTFRVNCEVYLE